jgi:hypothetical protein
MHALLTLDDWDLPRSCITEEKGIRASRRATRSQFCGASRLNQETLTPAVPQSSAMYLDLASQTALSGALLH